MPVGPSGGRPGPKGWPSVAAISINIGECTGYGVGRTHHSNLLARWNHVLSREQRKALRDIRDCRPA